MSSSFWANGPAILKAAGTRRRIYLLSGVFSFLTLAFIYSPSAIIKTIPLPNIISAAQSPTDNHVNGGKSWDFKKDGRNLVMNTSQCERSFPGLFEEVDRPVENRRNRKITKKELDDIEWHSGYLRGLIWDQQIYVIATNGGSFTRPVATLLAMYRAVTTSPDPLPNIEFVFSADDYIDNWPQWSYARKPENVETWLMPDFGYWAWPESRVGSFLGVTMKAIALEEDEGYSWPNKEEKLVWRGATMGLKIREDFLAAAENKPWSDVRILHWGEEKSMAEDFIAMDEHCKYKYVAHTEGNSYSGRLKYLQNCRSVIVAHRLDWLQHQHPLMVSAGSGQNYVQVDRDFSNLAQTMEWLQSHDVEAKRIADNNVATFRERYVTPAAQVCYWRALIRGWAAVSFEPDFFETGEDGKKKWRGVTVESYVLDRNMG